MKYLREIRREKLLSLRAMPELAKTKFIQFQRSRDPSFILFPSGIGLKFRGMNSG
jgi:hypothetical protein